MKTNKNTEENMRSKSFDDIACCINIHVLVVVGMAMVVTFRPNLLAFTDKALLHAIPVRDRIEPEDWI